MDSGNSGSMQSSSGGDEEYDSRAESISAFLNNNNNPLSHVGPMPNPPPPQPPPPDHHHHQTHHPSSSSMFNLLSNYFDPLSSSRSPPPLTNPNSFLNLDMVWSKNLRSETNCTDLGGFVTPSSPTQQFFTNQPQSRTTFPSVQIPQGPEIVARGSGSASASGSNDQTNNNTTTTPTNNIVRNPKKRSRASRRAPTTVLTTDTTNFRAMVQEFTGIPAPPFTSSPFPRSRLDLFGTASTLRSAAHLESPTPPYLLRPFAQKIQLPPPFLSPSSSTSSSFSTSSMVDAIASTTTTNINSGTGTNTNTSNSSTSINYQLSSDLGLLKQPQNLLNINMPNPILNPHSLLPKYPLPNSAILDTSKTQQGSLDMSSNDSHLKMGVLEEFGLSHGHVSTNLTRLQNIVSSSNTTLRGSDSSNNNNHRPANWGDGVGSNEGDQGLLRSINGNYSNSQPRVTNGKANYSASSSDFQGDKGPENVTAARSEGMMESWICSSD
ncbi:hypothetical protein P3X46_012814 [Hevea brasiliensis]|uniref:VQ domain-containing protein n=1 Tax=Hevea brasiliensis TaxID=3981 RepID=A0ABQ9ME29_HEVBR|nr:uncharacterized protein LOC110653082 [Hevea brasiliensis]KAJ9177613.1 hypothetical protein P3X46_012814 [Hevea brasiliensis]